jgi:hypothetical protein
MNTNARLHAVTRSRARVGICIDIAQGAVAAHAHQLPEPPIEEPEDPNIDHPPRPEPDVPLSDVPIHDPERHREPGRVA